MKGAVVYIDDEPAICRIFQWRLSAAGLPVETFSDPETALDWIRTHPVACVLCDHRMPAMSSLEVRERISKDVPFWIVTGDLSIGDELAGRPDVRGVLHKPLRFEELLELLRPLGERSD